MPEPTLDELPADRSAEEYRRRALHALSKTDPHYGEGRMFVDTAHVYALLALSAGGGDQ